jgi:trimeric autotransporter adhesin
MWSEIQINFFPSRYWALTFQFLIVLSAANCLMAQGLPTMVQNLTITGVIRSGNVPVPGATVTAVDAATAQKIVVWTALDGSYVIQVPTPGHYTIRVEMTAFAPAACEVDVKDSSTRADIALALASRREQVRQTTMAAGNRGFQSLSVMQGEDGGDFGNAGAGEGVVPPGMAIPGMAQNSATESISYSGNGTGSFLISSDELQQRMREARDQQGGSQQGPPGGPSGGALTQTGQPVGPAPTALAPRGAGGGHGGAGWPGGGPTMIMSRGRGRFDMNRPHGDFYYTVGDSALNAAPYSLTGNPTSKPDYRQQKFGAIIGGPLSIPKIYKGGTKTFVFANYNGSRGGNPYDAFSTVPSALVRSGDFAALCHTGFDSSGVCNDRSATGKVIHQIYDPCGGSVNAQGGCTSASATRTPFAGNVIPATRINSAAAGLLKFIPTANLPGTAQNFHYVTSAAANSDDLNFRVMHGLGNSGIGPPGRRHRGPQNNLTFGLRYHSADTVLTNQYPSVGGNTNIRSFDVPIGYIRSFGKLTNMARVDFNRSRTSTQNLYALSQDITGELGIAGVSQNPLDWGLPNLLLTHFGSLQDTNPRLSRNQTLTFSDNMIWNHGKHTWRWGGNFRRIQLNTKASNDARGTFIFTGINSGYDFADFLLGLPQQTQVQFGQDNYHFRGNSWDAFAQDEWKVRGNLTLHLGVRYEYVSPLREINNLIADLDLSPGVLNPVLGLAAVARVLPGTTGAYSGHFPATLIRPDRNNFAPRLGLAWKQLSKTVVRAGYGVNYNTTVYQTIAQQLAFQPPFSITQTNPQAYPGQLTVQQGFTTSAESGVTNNYAVDPNYQLGYLQIWNLDIQQEIRPTLIFNIDYTGTKGTRLDVVEAPNRCIAGQAGCATNGIRIPGVQAFEWQSSEGDSTAHAGSFRLRKRLQHGISIGGTYTFSKAIDDASTIGGGTTVVAQNPFDIAAERGLSVFDQRHRFTGDYLIELPFGHDKPWLSSNGPLRALFGDWHWSGDWTIASGVPFSPRILGDFADVSRGTNGTLRPDIVPGQPISVADPSIHEWFNTSAFVAPPSGHYGNARRNSIAGPGAQLFDMAFTKVIPLRESRMIEVRAQFLNIFNTPQYTKIDTTLNSPSYGQVIAVGAMRTIQFTTRFRF